MNEAKAGWKHKFVAEATEYWILVCYLACFFGAFLWYRRLILAEYHISYAHYGLAVLKALVLAKVILIADILHLGRRFENKPLIVSTLYKTMIFTLWVGVASVLESTIRGLLDAEGLAGGFEELIGKGKHEFLAVCLIAFLAFIPFFALKELERVLGRDLIRMQFFRRRAAMTSGLSK